LEEFPDVSKSRVLNPFLLDYVPCCFKKEMGLGEAGIMSFYYDDESGWMIFRVLREAIDQFVL